MRGFMTVIYRPEPIAGQWGSLVPREIWIECLRRSLGTFRLFNPNEEVLLVDVHGLISPEEARAMDCHVLKASMTSNWPSTTESKILALGISPFSETCLFDLDFHFCGPMGGVFDAVTESVGALHYPLHSYLYRRINTGLVVCRDKRSLQIWSRFYAPKIGDDDEIAFHRAVTAGALKATLLPDTYGRMLDNRPGGTWLERGWQDDQAETGALAYHWQSRKPQMASDTDIARLLEIGQRKQT